MTPAGNPEDLSAHNKAANRTMQWLAAILLFVLVFSFFLGRYPAPGLISPNEIMGDELAQRLILNLRVPRILTALLLGATLAAAGAVFQMIFANPLVEPGFLGVSQGAAFGAAFSILFLSSVAWAVQLSAAIFAILGLLLAYYFARKIRYGGWILRLILSGIAVSALFSAGLGILKYMADPLSQLQEITFWLLGGLYSITWKQFLSILPAVVLGLTIAFQMRWRLNLLSLGDETAFSLGAQPGRERALLLFAGVIATAAVISVSGMVSWVGLIVPHIARRLFGADSRYMLPGSMLLGAAFTILCDDLARTVTAGEIPLGILTSIIGATIFLILMIRQRSGAPA
ncbi:MAG TPA: iron ABC transporter permease [Bellilinea sp.]|nr:iron ABC transporter permease [Bellilinea sp.]